MDRWPSRRTMLVAAAGIAGSLAGCAGFDITGGAHETGWPQPRADAARTGTNQVAEGPAGPGERWSHQTAMGTSAVVVSGDQVYLGGDALSALSAGAGQERWRRVTPFGSRAAPAVLDGTVFAGQRSFLYALDAASGSDQWTHSSDARQFHSPTVAEGTVYVGTTRTQFSTDFEATVIAYDARTGSERWRADVGQQVLPPYAPAVDGDTVYAARDRLVALAAHDGRVRWSTDASGISALDDPAVSDGRVFVSGIRPRDGVPAGAVVAVDAADGREVWRYETELSPAPVAVADGTVYVAADRIAALDAATGRERWTVDTNRFLTVAPSVAGDRVYVAGIDGGLWALTAADGREVWRAQLAGTLLSTPAIVGDSLFVGAAEGRVFALGDRSSPASPNGD